MWPNGNVAYDTLAAQVVDKAADRQPGLPLELVVVVHNDRDSASVGVVVSLSGRYTVQLSALKYAGGTELAVGLEDDEVIAKIAPSPGVHMERLQAAHSVTLLRVVGLP